MVAYDLQCLRAEWRVFRQCFDLQSETLTDVTGADPGWFQTLQVLECDAQIFCIQLELFGQQCGQLFKLVREKTIIVEVARAFTKRK